MSNKTASEILLGFEKDGSKKSSTSKTATHICWNFDHVSFYSYNGDFVDFLVSVEYDGRSAYSISEYLLAYGAELGIDFRKADLYSNSYSVYDYYDSQYFPINILVNKYDSEVCSQILTKLKVEQLLIIDCDLDGHYSFYAYNYSSGLSKLGGNVGGINNKNVSVSVQEILSDIQKSLLGKGLVLDEEYETAWVFTGSLVSKLNIHAERIIRRLFLAKYKNLPLVNRFFVDKYQLLNYLDLFAETFIKTNLRNILYTLPIILVRVPGTGVVSLVNTSNQKKQLYVVKGRQNIYKLDKPFTLKQFPGRMMKEKYIWLWTPSILTDAFFENINFECPFVDRFNIPNTFKLPKKTLWALKTSKTLVSKQKVGEKFNFSKKFFKVKQKPSQFVYVGDKVKKSDLLVLHGQKVITGDKLVKSKNINIIFETKEVLAPVSGTLYTDHLDKGFIELKAEQMIKFDLSWLGELDPIVVAKGENKLELLLEAKAVPLGEVCGKSHSSKIKYISTKSELEKTIDQSPQSILVCNFVMSASELMAVYQKGVYAIVLPSIDPKEMQKIPHSFWEIFGLGIFAKEMKIFPPSMRKLFTQVDEGAGFLDVATGEFKYVVDYQAGQTKNAIGRMDKFSLQGEQVPAIDGFSLLSNKKIEKGDLVRVNSQKNKFVEAKVAHINDQGVALLKDLDRDRVFMVNLEELVRIYV